MEKTYNWATGFLKRWPMPKENICFDFEVFIGFKLGCIEVCEREISDLALLESISTYCLGVRARDEVIFLILGYY